VQSPNFAICGTARIFFGANRPPNPGLDQVFAAESRVPWHTHYLSTAVRLSAGNYLLLMTFVLQRRLRSSAAITKWKARNSAIRELAIGAVVLRVNSLNRQSAGGPAVNNHVSMSKCQKW